MKWFLALVLALNLFLAAFGAFRQHQPVDIHAQEVNPGQLKVLPADWVPPGDASGASASSPFAVAASAPVASAPAATKPPLGAASAPAVAKPAAKAAAKSVAAKAAASAATARAVPAPAKRPAALACVQWGALTPALLTRVDGGLPALKLAAAQLSRSQSAGDKSGGAVRFWVYYPEQPNGATTQALSGELKHKGFDNYIVQNDGEFQGAISLGLYGKRDAAQAMVNRLKSAGYAKAAIAERGKGGVVTLLAFRSLTAAQLSSLTALQKRLTPGLPLKSVSCGN